MFDFDTWRGSCNSHNCQHNSLSHCKMMFDPPCQNEPEPEEELTPENCPFDVACQCKGCNEYPKDCGANCVGCNGKSCVVTDCREEGEE